MKLFTGFFVEKASTILALKSFDNSNYKQTNMFQTKQFAFTVCLFLCLNTLFATGTITEGEKKQHKKSLSQKTKAKKKANKHDKCNVTKHHHHHGHEHEALEVNLEQELTAVYIYKILSNHAIWKEKNTTEGLKIAIVGDYNHEFLDKLYLLSNEVSNSGSKLPFVVEVWDKTKSLNLSEYHAIFLGNTDTQFFRNIVQIAFQNDIITFSNVKDEKMPALVETTVQFLVVNNKLKFSLATESIGKLIEEDLWKKSYKL